MSILTENILVEKILKPVWDFFDEKKTATGAVSLLFWVTFYALPAFHPEFNWITHYSTQVRDFLLANGIQLDNTSFNTGIGFTVIGILDKLRKNKT